MRSRLALLSIALVATIGAAAVVAILPAPRAEAATPPPDVTLQDTALTPDFPNYGCWQSPRSAVDPTASYPLTPLTPCPTDQTEARDHDLLAATRVNGALTVLYCAEIAVGTEDGVSYVYGTDAQSYGTPNLDYARAVIADYPPSTWHLFRVGEHYAPNVLQDAIWYFTDGYVVDRTHVVGGNPTPMADLWADVRDVVTAVQLGSRPAPPSPPSLLQSPSTLDAPVGTLIGPFTVLHDQTALTVTNADFVDGSGAPLPGASGGSATLDSGTRFWIRSSSAGGYSLSATADVADPGGLILTDSGQNAAFLQRTGQSHVQTILSAAVGPLPVQAAVAGTFTAVAAGSTTTSPTLAATGVDAAPGLAAGLMIMLIGAALILGRARSRRRTADR